MKNNFINITICIIILFFIPEYIYSMGKKINKKMHSTIRISLNFENALGIAINNNFELKTIAAQKTIYDLTVVERWRDYFPTLSLSYLQTMESSKHASDSRQHIVKLESDFVIYDGGKRGLNFDIAKLKRILAANDYKIALNKFIMSVYESYLNILQLKESIKIHQKTYNQGLIQLKFIKKEYSLGDATKLNVMEIEAQVKEAELNLAQAMDSLTTALNKFKLLIKLDWRQDIAIEGSIEKDVKISPLKKDFNFDNCVYIAVKNRKEVKSSDVEYEISRRSHLINKLYYFPKISLGLNYSLTDDRFFPMQKNWGINLKVSSALFGSSGNISSSYDNSDNGGTKSMSNSGIINIMDSLGYKRAIVESKIKMDSNAQKTKDIRQQVALEVFSSFSAVKNSWKMINIAKTRLELYDLQLKIERKKANMGETRRYDLMKKELERGEAAIAHLAAKIKYLMAVSVLENSMSVNLGSLKLSKIR